MREEEERRGMVMLFALVLAACLVAGGVGSPAGCLARMPEGEEAGSVPPLELGALPGDGWDNLQNQQARPVAEFSYTNCRFTADGKFLIPDNVHVEPIKSSVLQTQVDLISDWQEYTSTLSTSINLNVGIILDAVGISGQFSTEFRRVKSWQYLNSSITVRVQARFVRYTVQLTEDHPVRQAFRDRLSQIAALHEQNQATEATYQSQLLVRDYGSHFTTKVDAGAVLIMQDQVSTSLVRKYSSHTERVEASATVSFLRFFGLPAPGGGASVKVTDAEVEEYVTSRVSSETHVYGGPVFSRDSYDDWLSGLESNLVVIDRSGIPLYELATPKNLPGSSQQAVAQTVDSLRTAVEQYYWHNTHYGCTKPGRPNFDFTANVDDGSCQPVITNTTFGGVYQNCSGNAELCAPDSHPNPRTGTYGCARGYHPVLIFKGALPHIKVNTECHRCWLVGTCCEDKTTCSADVVEAYWCVAEGSVVAPQSGYLFGGVFTSTAPNPITRAKSCPTGYQSLTLLGKLTICFSGEYEAGAKAATDFGGFFTCLSGNPLAVRGRHSGGGSGGPQACPEGFTSRLAAVVQGCEVNYCIRSGALIPPELPPIQRPPFMPMPTPSVRPTSLPSVVGSEGNTADGYLSGSTVLDPCTGIPSSAAGSSIDTNKVMGGILGGVGVLIIVCIIVCTIKFCRK